MIGFTYRGKHSFRDMGVRTRTVSRPIAPPVRTIDDTVPYIDGTIDFSEQNGRLYYDDKVLELEIQAVDTDIAHMHMLVSKLTAWLCGGYGELIMDDMPNVRWIAKPIDIKAISPELFGRKGTTTVQFRCRPFNVLVYDSTGIPLDSDLVLDSYTELGYGSDYWWSVSKGSGVLTYRYIGTAPVAPRIEITGDAKKITIGLNEHTLSVSLEKSASGYGGIILDCEAYRCTGADGTELTPYTEGDFPELWPGENKISFTRDDKCMIQLLFYPNYLYGDVWE